jgi:hypothetical protein
MKLLYEETGSHILMSLPDVVVHRINESSPLMLKDKWYDRHGQRHSLNYNIPSRPRSGSTTGPPSASLEELKEFLSDREAEIVVLLEGVDELRGAAIQTRHSYTTDELAWNSEFVPVTFPNVRGNRQEGTTTSRGRSMLRRRCNNRDTTAKESVVVVDFAKFHETRPVPDNSEGCAYFYE